MDLMSPLYATILCFLYFHEIWNLHSKQIETLELAPKFVEQLFVNNKAYDPDYHAYCLSTTAKVRMLALPVSTLY